MNLHPGFRGDKLYYGIAETAFRPKKYALKRNRKILHRVLLSLVRLMMHGCDACRKLE